jgi:hypothetical protein
MFRTHCAHHQDRQIVSVQPLVAVTLCRVQVRSLLTSDKDKSIEKNCASRWSIIKNHYTHIALIDAV